jgi:hypothetical protein
VLNGFLSDRFDLLKISDIGRNNVRVSSAYAEISRPAYLILFAANRPHYSFAPFWSKL